MERVNRFHDKASARPRGLTCRSEQRLLARRKKGTPGPGPCVHCRKTVDVRTWDHVMPLSWYPDTTPADLQRWKVPVCIPCNSDHGRNEEELLVRMMMCFGNDDARAAGIPRRIIRSMDARHARNDRDRHARVARQRAVGRDMFKAPPPGTTRGVIPGFGPTEVGASGTAIRISGERVGKLAEKIVRGIVFLQRGVLIQDTHRIEWFFLEGAGATGADAMLRAGTVHSVGPGIVVRYVHTGEDEVASALRIEIWNRLMIYATVNPA